MANSKQEEVILLAAKISDFLMKASQGHPVCSQQPGPYDDFAYAEAIIHRRGHPSANSVYSTEDKFLLAFRRELEYEFGLEVLTRAEVRERAKLGNFITKEVTGIVH